MEGYVRPLIWPALLLLVSGCASSVSTSVDGGSVRAQAAFPNRVDEAGSTPHQSAINIAGGLFLVSRARIQWARGDQVNTASAWHAVGLPAAWKEMRLEQRGDGVVVSVDGRKLTTIRPAA